MTKRERKYFKNRPKPITGYSFTSFSIPAYDCDFKMPLNDEPPSNYLSNFALMMPRKAIKLPSKKEMKKAYYSDRYRMRGLRRYKPWEKVKIHWITN